MQKTTKRIQAVAPRIFANSTLSDTDVLEIVFDVYEPVKGCRNELPVVNIVLLHGTGMTKSIWEWYVEYFYKEVQGQYDSKWKFNLGKIITVDQVNHGDSCVANQNKLGSEFCWLDGSRDVIKICELELIPPSRNTFNVIIGHSMGGHQALGCGFLSPAMFQLIITLEPVLQMRNPPPPGGVSLLSSNYINAVSRTIGDEFRSKEEYYKFMRTQSIWKSAIKEIFDKQCDSEIVQEGPIIKTKTSKEQQLITYMSLYPGSEMVVENLKWITCPVVCYVGSESAWCPPNNYETLRESIKDYTQVTVQGAGHLMNLALPTVIGSMFLSHIAQHVVQASEVALHNRQAQFSSLFEELKEERVMGYKRSKTKL